jgi:hypothetical protein
VACLFHERYSADVHPSAGPQPTHVEAEDDHLVACFELDGACRPAVPTTLSPGIGTAGPAGRPDRMRPFRTRHEGDDRWAWLAT